MSDLVQCPRCRGNGSEPLASSLYSAPACCFCDGTGQIDRSRVCICGRYARKEKKNGMGFFCGRTTCENLTFNRKNFYKY